MKQKIVTTVSFDIPDEIELSENFVETHDMDGWNEETSTDCISFTKYELYEVKDGYVVR